MKHLFFILSLLFSVFAFGQDTEVVVQQSGDTIFQTTTMIYNDGRVVIEQIPFTVLEFADLMVDQNLGRLVQKEINEAKNVVLQRDVNTINAFLVDSLLVNKDSIENARLYPILQGDWILVERVNGIDTETPVTINYHPSLFTVLRMTSQGGNWNLKNISSHSWQINNYNNGTGNENVKLTLTTFPNFTGYRGKTSNNKILILKPI